MEHNFKNPFFWKAEVGNGCCVGSQHSRRIKPTEVFCFVSPMFGMWLPWHVHKLREKTHGAPGGLSPLSVLLLVSIQVMISGS